MISVCVFTCHCICVKVRVQLAEISSFLSMGFEDGTQVPKLAESAFTDEPTNINFSKQRDEHYSHTNKHTNTESYSYCHEACYQGL